MGIRLSSTIKNNASSGLKLTFKEDVLYDLDQLVNMRNRADGSSRLLIQVKYDKDVSREVINKLKNDISLSIESNLNNVDIQTAIFDIISKYPNDYDARINQYLKSILVDYDLKYFTVYYPDTGAVEISYDFDSNTSLTRKFQEYYTKYKNAYKEILENGSEGSLSISDLKEQTPTDASDFAKYLLGKEIKKEIDIHDLDMLYKKIEEISKSVASINVATIIKNTNEEIPTSKAVIDYTNQRLNTITNRSRLEDGNWYLTNLDTIEDDNIMISNIHSIDYDEETDSYGIIMEV